MTRSIIAPQSLIGMALEDELSRRLEASYDEDGYQDTVEADHVHDQFFYLEREVELAAGVAAVFAEESARFAA
jgi:hypothetical protein